MSDRLRNAHRVVTLAYAARRNGFKWRCIWCHDEWRCPPDGTEPCPNA